LIQDARAASPLPSGCVTPIYADLGNFQIGTSGQSGMQPFSLFRQKSVLTLLLCQREHLRWPLCSITEESVGFCRLADIQRTLGGFLMLK
jgi:hypothetical protein